MFEREPTPSDNPLLKPDHVLLTPPTAGATRDGMRKKARAQYETFRHVADGRPLINATQPYSKVGAEAKAYGLGPHGLMPTSLHQRKFKIVSFSWEEVGDGSADGMTGSRRRRARRVRSDGSRRRGRGIFR